MYQGDREGKLSAPGSGLACVTMEDLTGQRLQLKHLQARAVRSHDDVGVIGPQEPNIQYLLAIASKLWESGRS